MQAKNTEEGLHNLNGFLTFTDYVGLGTGVGSIIGRGLKYAGKRIGKKVTEDFIKNQDRELFRHSLDNLTSLNQN